jgi:steroid delta-isomerase-like uncharacterized protein
VTAEAATVARRYFDAVGRHDIDAAVACWAEGGIDNLAPVAELRAPAELRTYFEELFAAMPDLHYEVLEVVEQDARVAVHWRLKGTFTGSPYQGIRATGASVDAYGIDLVRVADGLIERNDSYWDDATVARQIGLLPARRSRQERLLLALFNGRTRLAALFSRRNLRRPG